MTATSLRAYSLKDLAQMAKRRGVSGWHEMRKDQLVAGLVRAASERTTPSRTESPHGIHSFGVTAAGLPPSSLHLMSPHLPIQADEGSAW